MYVYNSQNFQSIIYTCIYAMHFYIRSNQRKDQGGTSGYGGSQCGELNRLALCGAKAISANP